MGEAVKRYRDTYELTRWGKLCAFVEHWGPWLVEYDWRIKRYKWLWLGSRSWLEMLWSRATWRRDPLPVRPKNDRLIVPIEPNFPRPGTTYDWF